MALWFWFNALILTQPIERWGFKIASCYFPHPVPWLHQFLFYFRKNEGGHFFLSRTPICGVSWGESPVESWRGGCLQDNASRKAFLSWRHIRMRTVLKLQALKLHGGLRVKGHMQPSGSLSVDSILCSIQLKALWSYLIFGKVWKVWKARESSNLGLSRRLISCCWPLNGYLLPTPLGHLGASTRASQYVSHRGWCCSLSIHILWVANSFRFSVTEGMDFSQVWREPHTAVNFLSFASLPA